MEVFDRSDKLNEYKITLSEIIKKCDEGIKTNQGEVESRKIISESLSRVKNDYQKELNFLEKNENAIADFDTVKWNIFLNNTSTDGRFVSFLSNVNNSLKETAIPISDIAASAPTFSDTSGNSLGNLLTLVKPEFSIADSNTFHDNADYIKNSIRKINPSQITQFEDFIKEWVIKKEAFQKVHLLLKLRTILFDRIISYSNAQNNLKTKNSKKKIFSFIIGHRDIKELSTISFQRIDEIVQQLSIKQSSLSNIGKDRVKVTHAQLDTLMEETISLMASALKLKDAYFVQNNHFFQ